MLPGDACPATGVIVAALGPGVWRVRLPNGHELVARLRRRDRERPEPRALGPGCPVQLAVAPADMSHAVVVWDRGNWENDLEQTDR